MTAYGYIRQSRRTDLDAALSHDSQLAAIKRLALRDGIDPERVVILADLGRSGAAGKERLRPGYQALLAAMDTGAVSVVYTLTLSRLARSAGELERIAASCTARAIRLVTDKEGAHDPTNPMQSALFGVIGVFAKFERDLAVMRAKENAEERRRRGETMGRRPYGEAEADNLSAVLAAFEKAGSYNGAASNLNAAGLPSHQGRAWNGTSVRLVVARHRPELAPIRPRPGARSQGGFLLYGLLVCPHDGARLTGARSSHGTHAVRYRCHRADADPNHPSPRSIAESNIIAAVMAEAARFRLPDPDVAMMAADTEKRAALEAKRLRVLDLFVDGAIDKRERDERLHAIVDEMAKLDARRVVVRVKGVEWGREDGEVNRALRSLWEGIDLDPETFQPLPDGFRWLVPDFRG